MTKRIPRTKPVATSKIIEVAESAVVEHVIPIATDEIIEVAEEAILAAPVAPSKPRTMTLQEALTAAHRK